MKIKFNLIKLRNTLIFQIIEQDLMWNNVVRIDIPNGISIRRDNTYPYVEHFKSHNTLYLRERYRDARNRYDDDEFRVGTLLFENNTLRDECYDKIIESLKYWSEHNYA